MGEKVRKLNAVAKAEPKRFILIKATFMELQAVNSHPAFHKFLGSEALPPVTKLELYRLGQELAKVIVAKNAERMDIINALCAKDENGQNKQKVDPGSKMVSFEFPSAEAEKTAREQIDIILKQEIELVRGKVIVDISKLPDNLLSAMDMLVLESIVFFEENSGKVGAVTETLQ